MDLEKLRAKLEEIRAKMRALLDGAGKEDRGLTEEERTGYDSLGDEFKSVQASIEREEAFEKLAPSGQRTVPAQTPVLEGGDGSGQEGDKRLEKLKELGVAETRTVYNPKTWAFDVHDRRLDEPFDHFGQQLRAIIDSSQPGVEADPRLLHLNAVHEAEVRAVSGMSETIPHEGGFFVQKDFSSEILRRVYQLGQVISGTRKIPIGPTANGLKMNRVDETSRADGSRWGGIRCYWTDEAATMMAEQPNVGQLEMTLNKLTGLYYATDELLADTTAMGAIATEGFSEELTFKAEDAIFNGDGAGKPLGILNAGCLISVDKEGNQLAATVVYENIVKMWARAYGRGRRTSQWFINQDVEPELFNMGITVGTGGTPAYMPAGGLSQSPYGTLMGRPVVPVEYAATLGTVGDIVLADMSQYITIDKGAPQSASSIHVRFLFNESTFRIVWRLDGQPSWQSALTPFKGTNTQSPFVVLATRS